jgi:fatty-acid desaturase
MADLVILGVMYTLAGLGITVGFHRLFTHRSCKTTRAVRVALAVVASMAVEAGSESGLPRTASARRGPAAGRSTRGRG